VQEREHPPQAMLWSDNEADVDLLRFDYLASAVTGVIGTRHMLPVTIGVFGDWGSGKSSLIKIVQSRLSEEQRTLCLTFNGWLFEGHEDAKTALMGSILDAIEDRLRETEGVAGRGMALLRKLLKRVNWFQLASLAGRYAGPLAMGLPHVSAANIGADLLHLVQAAVAGKGQIDVEEAQKLLHAAPEGEENIRRNIRDFRKDFAALLKEAEIDTLVVFIDDLDRCLPDTVIETLEAIKLFLFVPGTAFVLGADEQLVQYAVRQRFPELPGTEREVGRDYLEKLVQVPIRIPPLSGAEIESYMNLLFAERRLDAAEYQEICDALADYQDDDVNTLAFDIERARAVLAEKGVPADLQSDLDLTAQIAPVLTPGLNGNPRRTKRFLNTLLLRLSMGEARGLRLERRVLAKLMLLEYLRSEFFKSLAGIQMAEGGRPRVLGQIEHTLRAAAAASGPTDIVSVPTPADDNAPPAADIPAQSTRGGRQRQQARSATKGTAPEESRALPEETLPAEIQPWLADPWMRNWLLMEPLLGETDLQPYFYIAHDRVGALGGGELRLSPMASAVLNQLLATGGATQELGLRRTNTLTTADAAALFQNLAQRVRQAESLDRSPHDILFKVMEHRPELIPQFIVLLGSLPETKIALSTPVLLLERTKDTPNEPGASALLDRWTRSKVTPLARAARQALNRSSGTLTDPPTRS